MVKPISVDEYIASCPREHQSKLEQLRNIILSSAPGVTEKISYGMPYYGYHGRLIYFQLWKDHIGLYIPPPIITLYKKELGDWAKTKATIHIPLDTGLPVTVIKKLLKARIKMNKEDEKG